MELKELKYISKPKKLDIFEILPNELFYEQIFCYINIMQLTNLCLVSKEVQKLINNNVTWKIQSSLYFKKKMSKLEFVKSWKKSVELNKLLSTRIKMSDSVGIIHYDA